MPVREGACVGCVVVAAATVETLNRIRNDRMVWCCKHDRYTFHIEATEDAPALIKQIKATGMKVGVAISPDTCTYHAQMCWFAFSYARVSFLSKFCN